eukprot:164421_1
MSTQTQCHKLSVYSNPNYHHNQIKSHLSLSMYHTTDWKEEEDDAKGKKWINTTDFVSPRITDYMNCCDDILKCNAVQRIIHLLEEYNRRQKALENSHDPTVCMYEYITSLQHYSVSTFMEDWYHTKTKHFKTENDYCIFTNNQQINCNHNCMYLGRHQRPRGRAVYDIKKEIDFKNIILRDQIDSIHTFIFHAASLRNVTIHTEHDSFSYSEEKYDEHLLNISVVADNIPKKQYEHDVLFDGISSVKQCTLEQILYIVTHQNWLDELVKLTHHKNEILNYFKENQLNGNTLLTMGRKNFYHLVSKHLSDNKAKGHLGKLYSYIQKFDITQMHQKNVVHGSLQLEHKKTETIVNSSKFTTSATNKQKNSYYAFGEQYRYTNNFKRMDHPWFVSNKYPSLRKELCEFLKRINETTDKKNLLNSQLETIENIPMDVHVRSFVIEAIKMQSVKTNFFNLWQQNDSNDDDIITLMNIITNSKLFQYSTTYDMSNNLLFQNSLPAPYHNMTIKVKTGLVNFLQKMNTQHKKGLFQANVYDINTLNNMINIIAEQIFVDDFRDYLPKRNYVEIINNRCQQLVVDLVYGYIKVHSENIAKVRENCFALKLMSNSKLMNLCLKYYNEEHTVHTIYFNLVMQHITGKNVESYSAATNALFVVLKVDKQMFYQVCIEQLQLQLREVIADNRNEYIKYQNEKRAQPYIQKANEKFCMKSVKAMKATWYHALNAYHKILPGDGLSVEHIIAIVCYSDNTELCTSFRETYRSISNNESFKQKKNRHSQFANMGRLIYEAFIFYATTKSEVTILYHGMSVPLLFTTLYCTFNAPTSTTTASSVASTFAENGIVIKFEANSSVKFIKTLDMSLFSCFDAEEEHLIFETGLHIKNIWN